MEDLFQLVTTRDREKGERTETRLAIRLKVGGSETLCPVSKLCGSYETLELEVSKIRSNLERILDAANGIFGGKPSGEWLGLDPDMDPERIWSILSAVGDEDLFVRAFNGLEEPKRRELAEHILTRCNIFAGKAALFSSRYNDESALMD